LLHAEQRHIETQGKVAPQAKARLDLLAGALIEELEITALESSVAFVQWYCDEVHKDAGATSFELQVG
jgi:hypothetical protein